MARILDFEQDPDAPEGYGLFHVEGDSKPTYGFEPGLAAQIQRTKGALDATPDRRVAGPGGGEPPQPMPPAAQIEVANQAIGTALANQAAQQAQPPAPPPPTMQQVADGTRDMVAQRAADELARGTRRTYVPGSPGVDPRKMQREGVMVHTGGTTTTEGGLPYDPEAAAARLDAAAGVERAQLEGIALQQQQTQNQLATQRAIAPKLEQQAAAAEQAHNQMLSAYRADRSRLQQEIDDYEKTAHVNPDRFFEDRGVFATIGLAIAQGLGAYASTMTGAPNFAYEMVQKAIDRDISAQREQIESGRVSRRNKMAQMMDNYGFDLPQAESAMRIAMNKAAANQAQMYANETKLPQYQNEANKLIALTTQEQLKSEQAFQAAAFGKQTRTVNDAFVQPKAATGGGYVEKPLTDAQIDANLKRLPTGQATPGQDWQELKPEQRVTAIKDYGTKKQEFADSRASLTDLADAYGLRVDWQRGELLDKDGKPVNPDEFTLTGKQPDIPGVGRPSLDRQAAHRTQEARSKAAAQTGKALSGASVSPQQAEYINSYLLGEDDAAAVRGLQRAVSSMNQVERDTEATFPDEARAEYARRSRGVNVTRKSAPAPVKVSDY